MADEGKTGPLTPASFGMRAGGKMVIVAILAATVVGVVWLKKSGGPAATESPAPGINPYTCKPCVLGKDFEKAQDIIERAKDQPAPEHRFAVHFFFSGGQCPCSQAIETGAYNTLAKHFSADLKSGRIEWTKLDVAEEGNAHFADEYELEPLEHLHNGLVIVEIKGNKRGRWKKLSEADALKGAEAEYAAYVKKEMDAFIQDEGREVKERKP